MSIEFAQATHQQFIGQADMGARTATRALTGSRRTAMPLRAETSETREREIRTCRAGQHRSPPAHGMG